MCAGGDRQAKTASKPPADSQSNQSAAASGTGNGAAQRKEALKGLAAKVGQARVCLPALVGGDSQFKS